MNLEITGKVIKILDVQSFTSKKPEKQGVIYKRYSFVLEVGGNYPKRTVFTVLGEDKWKQFGIVEGGDYQVSFDIDAREWNGKWFNDVQAWKVVNLNGGQSAQTQQPAPAAAPAPESKPASKAKPAPANGVSPFPTADAQPADDSDLPF